MDVLFSMWRKIFSVSRKNQYLRSVEIKNQNFDMDYKFFFLNGPYSQLIFVLWQKKKQKPTIS